MNSVKKTVLENGLTLISEYTYTTVESMALGIWIKAGSRMECPSKIGIAHFLEHMVFKGTKGYTSFDLVNKTEAVGGYLNAFTSSEYTCYYVHCLAKDLSLVLNILFELVQSPLLPINELSKEKKVVKGEIKIYNDDPEEYIFQKFVSQLFHKHPLGQPILGYEETVNSFTRDDLYHYMKKWYVPNNITIAVAGNIEHHNFIQYCLTYNHRWEKTPLPNDEFTPPRNFNTKTKQTYTKNIEQAYYIYGKQSIPYHHPKRYVLMLIETILGQGMSSRLHQNIREKYGYCYSIDIFQQFYHDSGIFCIHADVLPSHIGHLKILINQEIEKLIQEKISSSELENSKNKLRGKLLLSLESMANRMMRLAKNDIYYQKFISEKEIMKHIDCLQYTDIMDFSSDFFGSSHFNETVLMPN